MRPFISMAGAFAGICCMLAAAVVSAGTVIPSGWNCGSGPADLISRVGGLLYEQNSNGYTVRFLRDPVGGTERMEVLKDGTPVWSREGARFHLGPQVGPDLNWDGRYMGLDVTGDGEPNLVVMEYTDQTEDCCLYVYVFELGETFRLLTAFSLADIVPVFEDLDGDAVPEVMFPDPAFRYLNYCHEDFTAPEVILRYRDGRYRLAQDLMWNSAPTPATVAGWALDMKERIRDSGWVPPGAGVPAETVRTQYLNALPGLLWQAMIDLTYAGNMGSAHEFLEQAWPPGLEGREKFLEVFRRELARSAYGEGVEILNSPAVRERIERQTEEQFPLVEGTRWVYEGPLHQIEVSEDGKSVKRTERLVSFTDEVMEIYPEDYIFTARIQRQGHNEGWYIIFRISGGNFYLLGGERLNEVYEAVDAGTFGDTDPYMKCDMFLKLPLIPGQTFARHENAEEEDGQGVWTVSQPYRVNLDGLKGPGAEPDGIAYRIAYRAGAWAEEQEFVPGIGFTRLRYINRDERKEYDYRLVEFERGGSPNQQPQPTPAETGTVVP